jgi:hypothetical protein
MAIENDKYVEVVRAVNALISTGRKEMVRGWLVELAIGILNYYGYKVIEESNQ